MLGARIIVALGIIALCVYIFSSVYRLILDVKMGVRARSEAGETGTTVAEQEQAVNNALDDELHSALAALLAEGTLPNGMKVVKKR